MSASTFEKSAFGSVLPGDAVVDELAQLPLELRHQRRRARALQRAARVEEHLLLFAHVGLARAVHQQVADAVEHLRERVRQPMTARSRQSSRIFAQFARRAGRRVGGFGRGRVQASIVGGLRALGVRRVCRQDQTTS